MAEEQAAKKAPAGWYDDPKLVNTRRYWDGQKWTEHRQEVPPPAARAVGRDNETRTLFRWGLAMAVLLPVAGFIIGIVLLGKRSTWGVRVIILSVLMTFFYLKLAT